MKNETNYFFKTIESIERVRKIAKYETSIMNARKETRESLKRLEIVHGYDYIVDLCDQTDRKLREQKTIQDIKAVQDLTQFATELN